MTPLNPSDRPKFLLAKQLAGGRIAYYWSPPNHILACGAPLERRSLGSDYAEAAKRAHAYNDALDFWRIHHRLPGEAAAPHIIRGSIDDVFETYRTHAPSKPRSYERLDPSTRADYDRGLKRFANYALKDGRRVGEVLAIDLDPGSVDRIYDKLVIAEDGSERRRSANLMIAACRRAWNVAHRAKPDMVPSANPFARMGLTHQGSETTPATYAELVVFEEAAVRLDLPEFAFAARAAWELLVRVSEICERFAWTHWRPDDRPDQVFLGFAKNNNPIWKPLSDAGGPFYPELEDRLRAVPKRAALVCVHEARKGPRKRKLTEGETAPPIVWKAYSERLFARRAEAIRKAAGLPEHVTLTAFRHGGLTELGDAGLPDTMAQALSRHKQRTTLDRYIHRTDDQLKAASRLRLAHRRAEG